MSTGAVLDGLEARSQPITVTLHLKLHPPHGSRYRLI